jgi:hypothetical protein
MEEVLKARPVRDFPVPDGLVEKTVCADNGLLPLTDSLLARQQTLIKGGEVIEADPTLKGTQTTVPCVHTITEKFMAGTEPQRRDDWHQLIALDRRNGLRAGLGCPLDFVIFQTFTRYPAEADAWAKKQGVPQMPSLYSPLCPEQGATSPTLTASASPSAEVARPQETLVFTSPDQGTVFRLVPNSPSDKQKIKVSVRPVDGVNVAHLTLWVNGQPLTLSEAWQTLWQMQPGRYTFEASGIDTQGRELQAKSVTVEVVAYE